MLFIVISSTRTPIGYIKRPFWSTLIFHDFALFEEKLHFTVGAMVFTTFLIFGRLRAPSAGSKVGGSSRYVLWPVPKGGQKKVTKLGNL